VSTSNTAQHHHITFVVPASVLRGITQCVVRGLSAQHHLLAEPPVLETTSARLNTHGLSMRIRVSWTCELGVRSDSTPTPASASAKEHRQGSRAGSQAACHRSHAAPLAPTTLHLSRCHASRHTNLRAQYCGYWDLVSSMDRRVRVRLVVRAEGGCDVRLISA
jgi:hypothetical protein